MFGGDFSFAAMTPDEDVAALQAALRRVADRRKGRAPDGAKRD
jgi:hypothetical protein